MDRRQALQGLAVMFGAAIYAPIARAAAGQPLERAAVAAAFDGPPSAPMFTEAQRALVTALSERVIPTTDTPGAIAAGVPAYIEKFLADWALIADRAPVLDGLAAIEARSMAEYRVPAVSATPAQHDALLTAAMEGRFPAGEAFFNAFRQLVIVGYYTSEIGMTVEREYLPVPGEYNGEFPFANVGKVYSA